MLLTYADVQIERLASWSGGPVDLLAWVTRNLLEWSVWCRFVSGGAINMDKLLDDAKADLIDMVRFIPDVVQIHFSAHEKNPVETATLDRLAESTSTVLASFKDDEGRLPKRVRLSDLRNEVTEDFVFKLCSKLLHPTSVSLLLLPKETGPQLETRRLNLLNVALFYASVGLEVLSAMPAC